MKFLRYKSLKDKKVNLLIFKVLIMLIFICVLMFFLDLKMRPVIKNYSKNKVNNISTKIINDSISNYFLNENLSYDKLVDIKINQEGEIVAVETNSIAINIIRAKIVDEITENLSQLSHESINIPFGTFVGMQILSGKGPNVRFTIVPSGNVNGKLLHSFISAGINQTKHQIMLNININMLSYIPGYKTESNIDTNVIIAETIIVGKVPDAFTDIKDAESDLLSKINDYGAGH
ncbi:MAG: sporulation protein YunB [Oscillospiraceae bacterium]